MTSNNPPSPTRQRPDDLSESQLLQRPSPSSGTPQQQQQQAQHQPSDSPSATTPSPPSPSSPASPGPDLPLSMSTSTLLTSALPTDARAALAHVSATLDPPTHKITVRFQAIGDAPLLKVKVAKVSASHTFATVVRFLRKRLYGGGGNEGAGGDGAAAAGTGERKGESLFCYVNSVFAPGLDEGVGNLWRCFKVDDQLIVAYSRTPAFG